MEKCRDWAAVCRKLVCETRAKQQRRRDGRKLVMTKRLKGKWGEEGERRWGCPGWEETGIKHQEVKKLLQKTKNREPRKDMIAHILHSGRGIKKIFLTVLNWLDITVQRPVTKLAWHIKWLQPKHSSWTGHSWSQGDWLMAERIRAGVLHHFLPMDLPLIPISQRWTPPSYSMFKKFLL